MQTELKGNLVYEDGMTDKIYLLTNSDEQYKNSITFANGFVHEDCTMTVTLLFERGAGKNKYLLNTGKKETVTVRNLMGSFKSGFAMRTIMNAK